MPIYAVNSLKINILLLPLEKSLIVQIRLYGSYNFNLSMNKTIISTVLLTLSSNLNVLKIL